MSQARMCRPSGTCQGKLGSGIRLHDLNRAFRAVRCRAHPKRAPILTGHMDGFMAASFTLTTIFKLRGEMLGRLASQHRAVRHTDWTEPGGISSATPYPSPAEVMPSGQLHSRDAVTRQGEKAKSDCSCGRILTALSINLQGKENRLDRNHQRTRWTMDVVSVRSCWNPLDPEPMGIFLHFHPCLDPSPLIPMTPGWDEPHGDIGEVLSSNVENSALTMVQAANRPQGFNAPWL